METLLYTALSDGIPELDNRVYPLVLPQDTVSNSLTYRMLSQSEETCMGADIYGIRRHAQIDIWANSYPECVALSEKVSDVLHSNFDISGLFTVDIYEDYTLQFRRVVDFRIL